MVKQFDAEDGSGFLQPFGYRNIFLAWFKITARVVVGSNDRCGALLNRLGKYFRGSIVYGTIKLLFGDVPEGSTI